MIIVFSQFRVCAQIYVCIFIVLIIIIPEKQCALGSRPNRLLLLYYYYYKKKNTEEITMSMTFFVSYSLRFCHTAQKLVITYFRKVFVIIIRTKRDKRNGIRVTISLYSRQCHAFDDNNNCIIFFRQFSICLIVIHFQKCCRGQ